MKHLYVSTPVNTFHKNDQWQFLVFNYNDAVTQQINTCTQQHKFVGLQRNLDTNMPHCSSYACSNSTVKDISVRCLFVNL